MERAVYQTRAENESREDGSAAHRPPEGRAGHRAGGEETDSGGQFRVPRRGSVRRREDGERGTSKSTGRANAWRPLEGVMVDRRISKRLKGMSVWNGNLGSDRATTTKSASVRKQLCTKNSRSKESRQDKDGGVKGRERSAEELDRETGEEQTIVGRTLESMADYRLPKRAAALREQGRKRRWRLRWEDCVKRDVRKAGEEED